MYVKVLKRGLGVLCDKNFTCVCVEDAPASKTTATFSPSIHFTITEQDPCPGSVKKTLSPSLSTPNPSGPEQKQLFAIKISKSK